MKNLSILFFAILLLASCAEKPKPNPLDSLKGIESIGKTYREIKDAFKRGSGDTLSTAKIITKVETGNVGGFYKINVTRADGTTFSFLSDIKYMVNDTLTIGVEN